MPVFGSSPARFVRLPKQPVHLEFLTNSFSKHSEARATIILIGGSKATSNPSLIDNVMVVVLPISLVVGVPLTTPVAGSNVPHQLGGFAIVKLTAPGSSGSPSSVLVGVKLYSTPTVAVVEGLPIITGGVFVGVGWGVGIGVGAVVVAVQIVSLPDAS
jgi:hypothetical protein